ncbi:MAG: ShlB/FhaC/HecB family hemolysin secretion/activation protein [Bdellovibrio sp.]|nr:ShlB/FhaC/HecB family hemolysin secretion/activation protein [Methylotenera sp.]
MSQENAIADTKTDAIITKSAESVLDNSAATSPTESTPKAATKENQTDKKNGQSDQKVEQAEEKKVSADNKPVNYFDILEYQVQGNTKLSNAQIETAVYAHMGEKKTIDDVESARDALEKTYHQAGYLTVLVDIPEQEVNSKIVKLNVTEGKVAKLRIKDSNYYSLGRIKELSPSVKEGEVPYFPDVQKDVARLNRTADRRVTPVLKAGKAFGTVDVELKVEDKLPLHASLELNNRYSQNTTKSRLGGSIRYDNLWQREHSLSLSFQISPENIDEVKVLSANYLMRFDNSDILLALYGVRSKSNVATVGGINVLGDGTILGVRLIKPLPALDNFYHSISLGLDYKDFGQTVLFGGNIDSPITYMPLSAAYNATLQQGANKTQVNAGVLFGLRGLVADEAEFDNKRLGAKPNFFIAKAELEHTHALPKGFEGYIKLDGFFSDAALISNEQYLAGGADNVRGYLEAEDSGDQALHSTLELRSPELFKSQNWLQSFRLAAFYDIARIKNFDAKASILSGTGVGLRMKAFKNWNFDVDLAVPLKDSLNTQQGDFASHMRLWYEF